MEAAVAGHEPACHTQSQEQREMHACLLAFLHSAPFSTHTIQEPLPRNEEPTVDQVFLHQVT